MIKKRKLYTETVKQRIIVTITTIAGVFGGLYGGILYGDIIDGVIHYSIQFSVFGGIFGSIIAIFIYGSVKPYKVRNFIERIISNLFGFIGSILFGMTIGGFMGAFINHPYFIKFYSNDIHNSIIAINSNIGDGILLGGIAGGIGCGIGSLFDSVVSFFQDLILRFIKKPEYKLAFPAEKVPDKKT